jgi:hypothetical protein
MSNYIRSIRLSQDRFSGAQRMGGVDLKRTEAKLSLPICAEKMKPVGRMPGTLTRRFAGLKAPPSPEVEAGPFPTTRGSASQVTS